MSYEMFCKSEIGTVKELCLEIGLMRFVKSASHQWMVEFSVQNEEPFTYSRFTTLMTEIEASCLFDSYNR